MVRNKVDITVTCFDKELEAGRMFLSLHYDPFELFAVYQFDHDVHLVNDELANI